MKGLLFTAGLAYGGAAISLINPFVGLLVYVAFAILRPHELWFWSVSQGGHYSRIVALGLLAGWLVHGFGHWRFGRARPIVYALLALMAWSIFSAWAIAGNSDLAWDFIEKLGKIVLPFLVGITLIDSVAKLRQLAWVILLSEGYLALEFNLWYYGGYNRLALEGFGGMDNNCNAIALVTCLGLGGFLFFGCREWWQKAVVLVASGLMAHAVLLSFSRGGMLAMALTAGVAFCLIPKRLTHFLWLIAALAVMIWLTGPEIMHRFSTTFDSANPDPSIVSRKALWLACIESIKERPLGVGPANWGEVVVRYGFPRGKLAHTVWLQIGAELGLPGLGLLLIFYGTCVWRVFPMTREKTPVPDPWCRHLARMVIASLIGFAVAACFVSLELLEHPYYIALIGAGLLKLQPAGDGKQATGKRPGALAARLGLRWPALGPFAGKRGPDPAATNRSVV